MRVLFCFVSPNLGYTHKSGPKILVWSVPSLAPPPSPPSSKQSFQRSPQWPTWPRWDLHPLPKSPDAPAAALVRPPPRASPPLGPLPLRVPPSPRRTGRRLLSLPPVMQAATNVQRTKRATTRLTRITRTVSTARPTDEPGAKVSTMPRHDQSSRAVLTSTPVQPSQRTQKTVRRKRRRRKRV